MSFEHTIDDRDALRRFYNEPWPAVMDKQIDHVDPAARSFIERSPFAVLATTGPTGTDASPRGGSPGFIRVLDEHRVAMGDLSGNRRLDSYQNILDQPDVGLLLLIPGLGESLRINGRACLTTDPAVLDACVLDGARPSVAVGIDVDQVFLHCAKALRRSGLWDPASWPDPQDRPRAAQIFKEHLLIEADADVIEADLEVDYQHSLWLAGGADGEPVAAPQD